MYILFFGLGLDPRSTNPTPKTLNLLELEISLLIFLFFTFNMETIESTNISDIKKDNDDAIVLEITTSMISENKEPEVRSLQFFILFQL